MSSSYNHSSGCASTWGSGGDPCDCDGDKPSPDTLPAPPSLPAPAVEPDPFPDGSLVAQVAFRVSAETLERLDAALRRHSTKFAAVTRADYGRYALERQLTQDEAEWNRNY